MMQRLLDRFGGCPNPQTTEMPIHGPNPFDLPIRDASEYAFQGSDGAQAVGQSHLRYPPAGLTLSEATEAAEHAGSPRSTTSFELLGSQDFEDSRPASPMSIISLREVTQQMSGAGNATPPHRVSDGSDMMSSARESGHSSHRTSYEDTLAADLILGGSLVNPEPGYVQRGSNSLGSEDWRDMSRTPSIDLAEDNGLEGAVPPMFQLPSAAAGIVSGVLGRPAADWHAEPMVQPQETLSAHLPFGSMIMAPPSADAADATTVSGTSTETSKLECDKSEGMGQDNEITSEASEGWEVDMQATREELNAAGAEAEARAARPRSRLFRARSLPQIRTRGGFLRGRVDSDDMSGSEGGDVHALKNERDELACKLLETDAALAAEQAKLRNVAAEAAAQRALVMQLLAAQAPASDDELEVNDTQQGCSRDAALADNRHSRAGAQLEEEPAGLHLAVTCSVLTQLLMVRMRVGSAARTSVTSVITQVRAVSTYASPTAGSGERAAWPRRLQRLRATTGMVSLLWFAKAACALVLGLLLGLFLSNHAWKLGKPTGQQHFNSSGLLSRDIPAMGHWQVTQQFHTTFYPTHEYRHAGQLRDIHQQQDGAPKPVVVAKQERQLGGVQIICIKAAAQPVFSSLQPTAKALAARESACLADHKPATQPAVAESKVQAQPSTLLHNQPVIPLPPVTLDSNCTEPPHGTAPTHAPQPPVSRPAATRLAVGDSTYGTTAVKLMASPAVQLHAVSKLQPVDQAVQKRSVAIVPTLHADKNATASSQRAYVEVHAVFSGCAIRCSDARCTSRCTASRRDLPAAEPALAHDPPVLPSWRMAAKQGGVSSGSRLRSAATTKPAITLACAVAAKGTALTPSHTHTHTPTLPQLPPIAKDQKQQQRSGAYKAQAATCSSSQSGHAYTQDWKSVPLALPPPYKGITYDQYADLQQSHGQKRAWFQALQAWSTAASVPAVPAAVAPSSGYTALPAVGRPLAAAAPAAWPAVSHKAGSRAQHTSQSREPLGLQASVTLAMKFKPTGLHSLWDPCRNGTTWGFAARLASYMSQRFKLTAQSVQTMGGQPRPCSTLCSSNFTAQTEMHKLPLFQRMCHSLGLPHGKVSYSKVTVQARHAHARRQQGSTTTGFSAQFMMWPTCAAHYSNMTQQSLSTCPAATPSAPAQHAADSLAQRVAALAAKAKAAGQMRVFRPGSFGARVLQQLATPQAIAAKHAKAAAIQGGTSLAMFSAGNRTDVADNGAGCGQMHGRDTNTHRRSTATANMKLWLQPAQNASVWPFKQQVTCFVIHAPRRRVAHLQPGLLLLPRLNSSIWGNPRNSFCSNSTAALRTWFASTLLSATDHQALLSNLTQHLRHRLRRTAAGHMSREVCAYARSCLWNATRTSAKACVSGIRQPLLPALPAAPVLAALPAALSKTAVPAVAQLGAARCLEWPTTTQAPPVLQSNSTRPQQQQQQQQQQQGGRQRGRHHATRKPSAQQQQQQQQQPTGRRHLASRTLAASLKQQEKKLQRLVRKSIRSAAHAGGKHAQLHLDDRQLRQLKWAAADTRTARKQLHAIFKHVFKCQAWQAQAADKLLQVLDEGAGMGFVRRTCHPVTPGPNGTWVEAGPAASRAAAWKHTQLQLHCVMHTARSCLSKHLPSQQLSKHTHASMYPWTQQLLRYQGIASETNHRCEKVSERAWQATEKLEAVLTQLHAVLQRLGQAPHEPAAGEMRAVKATRQASAGPPKVGPVQWLKQALQRVYEMQRLSKALEQQVW